jgi:hypothetical protein
MQHNNEIFLDIKRKPVSRGDFVMYPVNTFLRFAVVSNVRSENILSVKYVRYINELLENSVLGRQTVSRHQRSIVKITGEELFEYIGEKYYDYMKSLSNTIKFPVNAAKIL